MFLRVALNVLLTCTKSSLVFVRYSVLKNPLHYYPLGSGFCYPILRKNYFLSLIPNERGHF